MKLLTDSEILDMQKELREFCKQARELYTRNAQNKADVGLSPLRIKYPKYQAYPKLMMGVKQMRNLTATINCEGFTRDEMSPLLLSVPLMRIVDKYEIEASIEYIPSDNKYQIRLNYSK